MFKGDQTACKAFLRQGYRYYIYVLRRPDGRPFYVGKGIGDRAFAHENEARHPNDFRSNAHKLNVIRSIWREGAAVGYEIDSVFESEQEAYVRETALISQYKRLHEGGPLTNRAAGGGSILGPAPISKEKHSATLAGSPADNPERATLNEFVLSIAPMRSVILKPVSQFVARPSQPYPGKTMAPTLRQMVALVASASANGIRLDGACIVPRRVEVFGVKALVENGVSCDLVTSGAAVLNSAPNPADETFSLTAEQTRGAVGMVGRKKCFDLGAISSIA